MEQRQPTLLAYQPSDGTRLRRCRFDFAAKDLGVARLLCWSMACINRQPGINPSQLAEVLDIQRVPMGRLVQCWHSAKSTLP